MSAQATHARAAEDAPRPAPPRPAPPRPEAPAGVDLDRVVLVCGVGRSGTSLLQSMLNAHPELALPPETHFFRRYVAPDRTRRAHAAMGIADLARTLERDTDFARAGVAPLDVLEGEQDGAIDLARVHGRLLRAWAAPGGKSRVGDKDPRNLDFLPELARAYPRGYAVHIVRDPRAVVQSRTKAAWSARRPWWSHALIAQEQLRRGRRAGGEHFGDRYLEVRYESLVAAPAEELARICRHVGVAYDDAMLDFGASAERLVGADEMGWKRETLGPLLPGNVDKWRNALDPAQVRFIEGVCVEAFDRLGYERSERRAAAPARALHAGARAAARAACAARRIRDTRGSAPR